MRLLKKIARWSLWGIAALVLLLAVLHFLLPLALNTRPLKEIIALYLNQAVPGGLRFGHLKPQLLPLPGLALNQVQYDLPSRLNLSAETVAVYPRVLALLRGRVDIDQVRVVVPVATVHWPASPSAPDAGTGKPKLPDLSGLPALAARFPDHLSILLSKGQITFVHEGQAAAQVRSLSALIEKNGSALRAELKGNSDWAEHFHLEASVDTASLIGAIQLEVKGAQSAKWESALRSGRPDPMIQAAVDLQLSVQSRRGQVLEIAFSSTAPEITLTRGGAAAAGRKLLVKGAANLTQERLHLEVNRLQLEQPRLNLSTAMTWQRQGDREAAPLQLSLQAQDSDVTALLQAVKLLAGDAAETNLLLRVIQGGQLVSLALDTAGDSLAELAQLHRLRLSGKASGVHIVIPGIDLNLTKVSGDWQLSEGVLAAQHAGAQLGESRGHNGTLRLGLREEDRFLELDLDLTADLAQLPPVLNKVVRNRPFRAELARIQSIQGRAAGRLSISGPLDDLEIKVAASDFSFTAEYDRLPYPLAALGRGLSLTRDGIVLKEANVRMSRSAIDGLSGGMTWRAQPKIDIRAAATRFGWDQLYPWLVGFAAFKERFNDIEAVGGRLALTDSRLDGPLGDLRRWRFTSSGNVDDLTIRTSRLPSVLSIPQGTFEVLTERLSFADMRIRMLDSDIKASGTISAYREDRPRASLAAKGVIGDEAAVWLQQWLEVPAELKVRAPIAVEKAELFWQPRTETRLQGVFILPGELKLGCALTSGQEGLNLQELTIRDELSDARMALRYDRARKIWELGYRGSLANATLVKLLRNDSVYAELIEGDFSARIPVDQPAGTRLDGSLMGRNLILPFPPWRHLHIRQFDLGARQELLEIRRLDVTVDEQRASITGVAVFDAQGLALDVALSADTLDLGRLVETFKTPAGEDQMPPQESRPAMTGWTARVDMGITRLIYNHYALESLLAVLTLQNDHADIQISDADLCGISARGSARWTPGELRLELVPQAAGQPLQFVTGCLTGAPSTERIEGSYEVSGKLFTQGTTAEVLTRNLKGVVRLNAVDGRVFNAGEVGIFSNLLSFLHINNLITGDFPNLRARDFKFKRFTSELEFKDGRIELNEAQVTSDGLNMAAEGKINMLTRKLDLTVLVSPLTTIDAVIKRIPIVGRILGGTLVAVPVGVRGPLTNPNVTPLSPKAVGSRLLGIMERTLETPFKLIEPILPSSRKGEQGQGAD
ncbi:MAG: hypothetical protein C4519_12355 [Desulfobacteraceae bacterium]|nr:MAG: hypothetical protein C4519_12355 [Desulfobacteraceae bacterium]